MNHDAPSHRKTFDVIDEDFYNEVLVVCPRCSRLARVNGYFASQTTTRLSCGSCGYVKSFVKHKHTLFARLGDNGLFEKGYGDEIEATVTLFLRIAVGHEVLWALNEEHLDWLEQYVRARLRERERNDKWGWQNIAMASRIPKWIASASKRDHVLKGIDRLKQKLKEATAAS